MILKQITALWTSFPHGLESKLSDQREPFLKPTASSCPDVDYKSNSNAIQNLYDEYHNQDINV
jgi:hypothetical protein